MTADPLWDDRPTTEDDPHRKPGESEAEHVHRTIANLRQTLNAKKIPPGKQPRAAYSEPVTE